mgnify:CR=1 FL=1
MKKLHLIFMISVAVLFCLNANAQGKPGDKIWGEWFTDGKKSVIKIYRAKNGMYYGKIVWLEEPRENGKPKLDKENPDKSKRDKPLIGLLLLREFDYEGDNEYSGGTIYDPENGKTYRCTMTMKGDKLFVRGYVGVKAFGRTTTWTRKK